MGGTAGEKYVVPGVVVSCITWWFKILDLAISIVPSFALGGTVRPNFISLSFSKTPLSLPTQGYQPAVQGTNYIFRISFERVVSPLM